MSECGWDCRELPVLPSVHHHHSSDLCRGIEITRAGQQRSGKFFVLFFPRGKRWQRQWKLLVNIFTVCSFLSLFWHFIAYDAWGLPRVPTSSSGRDHLPPWTLAPHSSAGLFFPAIHRPCPHCEVRALLPEPRVCSEINTALLLLRAWELSSLGAFLPHLPEPSLLSWLLTHEHRRGLCCC